MTKKRKSKVNNKKREGRNSKVAVCITLGSLKTSEGGPGRSKSRRVRVSVAVYKIQNKHLRNGSQCLIQGM